jgi:hypothetical protein
MTACIAGSQLIMKGNGVNTFFPFHNELTGGELNKQSCSYRMGQEEFFPSS